MGRNTTLKIWLTLTAFMMLAQPILPAQSQTTFDSVTVTIGPRFSSGKIELRGISGGTKPAESVAGIKETVNGPCVGFVADEPNHTLILTSFFNYLRLQVQSPQDTTLVIQGPGGVWCNDDYDGKNAGIAGQWLEGEYKVWVGSYNAGRYHPYIIRITEQR